MFISLGEGEAASVQARIRIQPNEIMAGLSTESCESKVDLFDQFAPSELAMTFIKRLPGPCQIRNALFPIVQIPGLLSVVSFRVTFGRGSAPNGLGITLI